MRFERPAGQRSRRGMGTACGLLAGVLLLGAAAAQAKPRFSGGEDLPVERKRAYDLGVTDYDTDGALDLYTTNHMFRESLLRGGPDGFTDAYRDAGFAPNPQLPGFEDLTRKPRISKPGLYLFARAGQRRPNIRIASNQLRRIEGFEGSTVSGRIRVAFPKVKVRRQSNATVEIREVSRIRTVIEFEMKASARIVLKPNHIDLPFSIEVDEPLPLERVYLGSEAVSPSERKTQITLGDRHGVAWGDYDRDGVPDAFITNGGLSGKSKSLPRLGGHELLLSGGAEEGGLGPATAGSGLRKASCRGREALPLDYDGDGVLDLFSGCRGGRPRLYLGNGDGTFDEARSATRPLGSGATANRLLDLDNDGRLELVQAGQFFVRTWRLRRSGRLRRIETIETPNDDKNVEAIAPGDFDSDGDLDLYVAAPSGSSLLVNRRGRLRYRDPRMVGLPHGRGVAAGWVDFDNDGDLDLHTAPGGLFVNTGQGRFRESRVLGVERGSRFARASWLDVDGDGRRDLAQLTQRGRGLFPTARLFRNRSAPGSHWLALDLRGRRGNRDALGARVRLRAGRRSITQWVGQNDGSRYGQGHYRLYFGLGKQRRARRVTVIWPDGGRTKLGTLPADRLRTVSRSG